MCFVDFVLLNNIQAALDYTTGVVMLCLLLPLQNV